MAASISFLLLISALALASCRPFDKRFGPYLPYHTSFHFPHFSTDLSSLTLVGDAHICSSPLSSLLQVSGSQPLSVGSFFYSKPIRFVAPCRSPSPLSFSAFFSFSMSAKEGNGLAFVISSTTPLNGADGPWLGLSPSPSDARRFTNSIVVEFDSVMNEEMKDPNDNHVGLNVENLVSLATANASDVAIKLNDGNRVYAWIDYHAPARVLEVRLSKSVSSRPWRPLLSYRVDLSKVLKEEMYVGFSSSTGDSPQRHIVYSWGFTTMNGGVHSFPVDPHGVFPQRNPAHRHYWHDDRFHHHEHHHEHHREHEHDVQWYHSISMQVLRIGMALLLGALVGSLFAVAMVVVWTFLRRVLKPSHLEVAMHPILFGYRKLIPEGK